MTTILHIHEAANADGFAPIAPRLERAGYAWRALVAGDGCDLIDRVVDPDASSADLIIVEDAEICQKLKADPRTASVPIVQLLAADATPSGTPPLADAYLTEPIHAAALTALIQLVVRSQRIERTHACETERWRRTFDALADPVVVLDAQNEIIDCNSAMDALLKRETRASHMSAQQQPLWHELRSLAEAERTSNTTTPGSRREAELTLQDRRYRIRAETTTVELEPSAYPPHTRAPDDRLTVLTLSDITDEHTHAEREAVDDQSSADDLTFVTRRQEDFLAMLAHELRNPLNAIVAANRLQQVHQDAASPQDENARLRSVVDRQSRHLARLIDDLLDVSRITRGEISLRLEPVDLREVVQRACESQRAVLRGRDQHLRMALPAEPILIDGDELRLEQAFANLIANASKYSTRGASIALRMLEERDGDKRRAVLVLNDHGIGIPPDMLESVFEMFFQVDRSLDRTLGGLGLGLTVVKYVIERHGGSVRAHSDGLGKGSRFVVNLPMSAERPALTPLPSPTPHNADAAPVEVLLIEDNDDTRELMCTLLENHGHHVVCAADGTEGIQMATQSPPQVALIDIGLPGMNGYAVARRLRDSALREPGQQWSAPFLVALTGYGSPADRERASAAGFDAHMVKPIDTSRLFELLRHVAQHRRSRVPSAQSA